MTDIDNLTFKQIKPLSIEEINELTADKDLADVEPIQLFSSKEIQELDDQFPMSRKTLVYLYLKRNFTAKEIGDIFQKQTNSIFEILQIFKVYKQQSKYLSEYSGELDVEKDIENLNL
jgi:hypothetical protein